MPVQKTDNLEIVKSRRGRPLEVLAGPSSQAFEFENFTIPQLVFAAAMPATPRDCAGKCLRVSGKKVQGDNEQNMCGVGLTLAVEPLTRSVVIDNIERNSAVDRYNDACDSSDKVCEGDIVLAINGRDTKSMEASVAERYLVGVAGSEVEVFLHRPLQNCEALPSHQESAGPVTRKVRLMRGNASFWHFYDEVRLLQMEIERRKGAYELLKSEHANNVASLARCEAKLEESICRVAALERECDDVRQREKLVNGTFDKIQQRHEEAKCELERRANDLSAEVQSFQRMFHVASHMQAKETVQDTISARDETSHFCDSIESCVMDLQALVFQSLRHSRLLHKEREAERSRTAQAMRRFSETKDLQRKTDRQRRQQLRDMLQRQGVFEYAARTLFSQLSHMGAELETVVETLALATRQEEKYIAAVLDREGKTMKNLEDVTRLCEALTLQAERAVAFNQDSLAQCGALEEAAQELITQWSSLQEVANGVVLERAVQHRELEQQEKARRDKGDALLAHVKELQAVVSEQEQARGEMALKAHEYEQHTAYLEKRLEEARRDCGEHNRQVERVKREATAELARLLGIISALDKQQRALVPSPQCCGIGVVLEASRRARLSRTGSVDGQQAVIAPRRSASPQDPSYTTRASLVRSPHTPASGYLGRFVPGSRRISGFPLGGHADMACEESMEQDTESPSLWCEEFVVRDIIDGFSAATSCALQRGDRVLAIDGLDVRGKTETAVASMLHGPRGTMVRLVCVHGDTGKPFGVRLRRGRWGAEHALLTEEEDDLHIWSQQTPSPPPISSSFLGRRVSVGVAV